jgi:aspartyl-tRNA(Asn)/glutamyl-tRNA(Gln) amidotransferase subunit B
MEVMMGLEVHCQLATKSKLFCSDSNESAHAEPNSNTCPICLGFPGSKPVINKKAIDFGLLVAIALNCNVSEDMFFSRKSYFYPDMSKNYQVTQYEIPLGTKGFLDVGELKVNIRRVHLEEDPAKLSYVGGDITNSKYVLIDYNRAGAPLLEIVTEPDFRTTKQVREFLEKLASILEHLGVYDPDREASLRVDSNISMENGERIEVKNITGFANVEKAMNYEMVRQSGMIRMGMKIQRETRHFDESMKMTKGLRKKEYEEDYGYIFDPDLSSIRFDKAWIDGVKKSMPELPDHRAVRFAKQYGISEYDAKVMVYTDKNLADFYEKVCGVYKNNNNSARWILNYLLKSLNWNSIGIKQSKVTPESFVEFLTIIDNGTVTERYAKDLIKEYVDTGESPKKIAERIISKSPKINLEEVVIEVLASNAKAVEEFKSGKEKALEFVVGQILMKTNKQADPKEIRRIVLEKIK